MRSALFAAAVLVSTVVACTSSSGPEAEQGSAAAQVSGRTPKRRAPGTTPGSASTATTPPPAASKFACSGAGIAAYADALVQATRKNCTSDGVGVVTKDNNACMQTAINNVAPPHADESFNVVDTLLTPNDDFPLLECTYFVQAVTAGVCGTPVSPSDRAWTDYPYACEFIDKAESPYTWFDIDSDEDNEVGDIFVFNSSDGCNQDPGHIMILAEILDDGSFRIAEANEMNSNGTDATDETGVTSNGRTMTSDDDRLAGWYRINASTN